MLEILDLVKHYKLGKAPPICAVDGVTLRVEAGEFSVLYGPSGSGKSTLIDLVAAAQKPDSGTVRFDGRDLAALSEAELDEYRLTELGVIGAQENLTEGATVVEEASLRLDLTNTPDPEKVIVPVLISLGLGKRLRHRTQELSMGERQRVMIAMALATKPKLVLADEPTGNLDTQNSESVLRLLRDICDERGTAILLATHDLQAATFASHVHELRDGRLRDYRPGHILVPAEAVGRTNA